MKNTTKLQLIKTNSNYNIIRKKVKCSIKQDLNKFLYYYEVWDETEKNAIYHTEINKRSQTNHLDHIIPISLGYQYNISPKIIGSLNNIRFITLLENFKKNSLITDEVINKLSEFNIDINSLTKVNSLSKPINKPKEIEQISGYQSNINDNKRLSIYPKGNKKSI